MIVKCKATKSDKSDCPMIRTCLARLSDRTITGCGVPLAYAGVIKSQIVEQSEDGDVTVKSTDDASDFIRAHVKFYRRISKRDALRMISSVRFLSETEGLY